MMGKRRINEYHLIKFELSLREDEKSQFTIKKYLHDVRCFRKYTCRRSVNKKLITVYKQSLIDKGYAIESINGTISSINSLLNFMGWEDCKVKRIRTQPKIYWPEDRELTREEYLRLVETAEKNGNERLAILFQTICATGIRVSELQYITVEAAMRGEAAVICKGKTRRVFIVNRLREHLLSFAERNNIKAGPVFITRTGRPLDRSNVWRQMKSVCEEAEVNPKKVFPHNMRHLFARSFYDIQKDISRLADVLGHSNINTTRTYIVSSGKEHREILEQMHLTF